MGNVFVTWKTNWADEMDISGHLIMDQSEWDEFVRDVKKQKDLEIVIGSNQIIPYENGEELLSELKAVPITPEEEMVLNKFIGDETGFTDFIWACEDHDDEDDDEDYED